MTTSNDMDLSRRLNRASLRRFVIGVVLSAGVLVAGLAQPGGPTHPTEAKVPATYPVTLGG